NKVTRKKVDRGQRIEDSPPTLKLRRIYVDADPWSAKKKYPLLFLPPFRGEIERGDLRMKLKKREDEGRK
ncbi:MAG: hypothetical protein J7L42_06700, partial [Elusimicrobia bacterium]|nr:hypothetical protein [Elusimicrobiota bacterium]